MESFEELPRQNLWKIGFSGELVNAKIPDVIPFGILGLISVGIPEGFSGGNSSVTPGNIESLKEFLGEFFITFRVQ